MNEDFKKSSMQWFPQDFILLIMVWDVSDNIGGDFEDANGR